jgi:hypothetical protein
MIKLEILKGINPKKFFPEATKIIVYAFTIGDKHYFRFDDIINIPYQRGLQTLVYYKEMDMNCDRDFLKAHCQAIEDLFKKEQLNIDTLLDIRNLGRQLSARLELPKEPDLMYKFASVVYFDQTENPANYEFKYGEGKIRFWKKNLSLQSFFLSKPLRELIPYLRHAGENLQQFSLLIENETKNQWETILGQLSEEQRTIYKDKLKLSLTPTTE